MVLVFRLMYRALMHILGNVPIIVYGCLLHRNSLFQDVLKRSDTFENVVELSKIGQIWLHKNIRIGNPLLEVVYTLQRVHTLAGTPAGTHSSEYTHCVMCTPTAVHQQMFCAHYGESPYKICSYGYFLNLYGGGQANSIFTTGLSVAQRH